MRVRDRPFLFEGVYRLLNVWGFPFESRTGRSATLSSSFRVGRLSLTWISPLKSPVDALGLVNFSTAIVECVPWIVCDRQGG